MREKIDNSPQGAQRTGSKSELSPSAPSPRGVVRWLKFFNPSAGRSHQQTMESRLDAEQAQPKVANPFQARNPPVEDVAVPLAEIVAVPMSIRLPELVEIFRDSGRTRLPVYNGSLDSPCGFIHLKDLALQHGFNGHRHQFKLKNGMLRRLLYVPGNMRVAVLLEEMRTQRIHMALIVDEYGGTDGLVTIEDLVEVIFGDIADEHDDETEEEIIEDQRDRSLLCHARLPLKELSLKLNSNLDLMEGVDDEVDTLGGLIFVLAGRVPVTGEVVRHEAADLDFEIVSANRQLIRQVRVRPHPRINH